MRPTRSAWRSGCRRTRSCVQLVTDSLSCSPRTPMRQMLLSEGGDVRRYSLMTDSEWTGGRESKADAAAALDKPSRNKRSIGCADGAPSGSRRRWRTASRSRSGYPPKFIAKADVADRECGPGAALSSCSSPAAHSRPIAGEAHHLHRSKAGVLSPHWARWMIHPRCQDQFSE